MSEPHIKSKLRSYDRGHRIESADIGEVWVYEDTGDVFNETNRRPCKRCGKSPTPEGYDACLGYIKGAKSVCCGHGVTEPILMMKKRFGLEYICNLYFAITDALFILQMKVPFLRRFSYSIKLADFEQHKRKDDTE